MTSVSNKVVIVTGAGRGIGRALSVYLASHGAKVLAVSYSQKTVGELAAYAKENSLDITSVVCDVADKEAVNASVELCVEQYGTVDAVINNAIRQWPTLGIENATMDSLNGSFEIGILGPVYYMQAVFPIMKEKGGGSIINATSGTAVKGDIPNCGYLMAKGAIMSITRGAARDWAKYGIRVNCYGPVALTDAAKNLPLEVLDDFLKTLPLGYVGDAIKDVAPAIAFFVSDDSHYVTGQTIMIDGGETTCPS